MRTVADEQTLRLEYDIDNHLVTITSPDGRTTTLPFDAEQDTRED